jgi:predicted acetyltransferase
MEEIELVLVSDKHSEVLLTLSRLYTYDLSEIATQFHGYQCDEKGLYAECVRGFIEDPSSDCYLLKMTEEWAGFAIVKRKTQTENSDSKPKVSQMAEFFLVRKFRRQGVATTAACRIFDCYPGEWEVSVWPENHAACSFWNSAISDYRDGKASVIQAHHPDFCCEMITYTF